MWSYTTQWPIHSSPMLSASGDVYFNCDREWLCRLEPSGGLKRSAAIKYNCFASPAIGNDGSILFSADVGCFYALGPG
jgi:hypothetical protein